MNGSLDTGLKIDGMNYPSAALRADDTNIALFPSSADRALRLHEAHVFRVNAVSPEIADVTYLDESREICDGAITWGADCPPWTAASGGRVIFRDTDAGWRAFDPSGQELELP